MKKVFFAILLLVANFSFSQLSVFDVARKGTLQEIESLYKANPDAINQVNESGNSPLILACYKGNEEVAKFLIKNVKEINYNTGMGTALMAAIVKGNESLTKHLLENKADVNLTDANGTTALMYAVQFQNVALVELLLQYKADKNLKNKEGKTAFEIAVFTGNQEIINKLKNI